MNVKHLIILLVLGFSVYFFKSKIKVEAPKAQAEVLVRPEIKAEFPVIAESVTEATSADITVAQNDKVNMTPPNGRGLPGDYYYPVRTAERSPGFSDNWDFRDSNLTDADFSSLFAGGLQPAQIVNFDETGSKSFEPAKYTPENEQNPQTWYTGSGGYSKRIADERKAAAAAAAARNNGGGTNVRSSSTAVTRLPEAAFEVASFKPGKTDNNTTIKNWAPSVLAALQGPDFVTDNLSFPIIEREMRALLSTILSLGYGGELTLKITGEGYLNDENGFDFALYENAFRSGGNIKLLELGKVGVSMTPDDASFKWFDCRPSAGVLAGCFGAVPTQEGGDQFDLSAVGLKQIRYIKIRDINVKDGSKHDYPTEGCDVDALRVFHAYTAE